MGEPTVRQWGVHLSSLQKSGRSLVDAAKNIFIVEDDVDLADMLAAYFRAQSYQVGMSTWGEDAIRQINENVPDVVLLDIRLPDIDGYEVCRRLRNSRRTENIPIIFLTERRERDYRLAGLELGAVDYITKPFDISELRLRVRNVLRRTEMQSLQSPITGLPEGAVVREQLEAMMASADWAVLVISLRGLDRFRNQYGFVAADDVTRAVGLMVTNAMQDTGSEGEFVGHLNSRDFVIITTTDQCKKLVRRCQARLEPSVQFFYPAIDRPRINHLPASERLWVRVGCIDGQKGPFKSVEELTAAIAGLFD